MSPLYKQKQDTKKNGEVKRQTCMAYYECVLLVTEAAVSVEVDMQEETLLGSGAALEFSP